MMDAGLKELKAALLYESDVEVYLNGKFYKTGSMYWAQTFKQFAEANGHKVEIKKI